MNNWYEWEGIQEKLNKKRDLWKIKKEKVSCHVCLKVAWQWREQIIKETNNLREEIKDRKRTTVFTVSK